MSESQSLDRTYEELKQNVFHAVDHLHGKFGSYL